MSDYYDTVAAWMVLWVAGPTISDVAVSNSGEHLKSDEATWTPKDVQQPKKEL